MKTSHLRQKTETKTLLGQVNARVVGATTLKGHIFSPVRPFYERAVGDLDP
jgi:hypothetical protein